MKKKIIAILTCVILLVSLCFIPDVDAGTSTFNITNATYYVEVGKSFTIKLNGIKASKVKWSSSKKSVATVSKKGVVDGVKKGKTTITGKYKNIKFKIKVNVVAKDDGDYSLNDISAKFKKTKVYEYDRDMYWEITFTFTNKGSVPTYFENPYDVETYINNVEEDCDGAENEFKKIKNGASIDVTYTYEVKNGDKIDFKLLMYDEDFNKYLVYSTSANIP